MAAATVRIPSPLRPLTQGRDELSVEGQSVGDLLDNLERQATGIKARICDDHGRLRRFVNVFINDEDIRFIDAGLETPIRDGDAVSIVPAIAGGAR
jgi:molybdopterin synthase sulfur carrier subunit